MELSAILDSNDSSGEMQSRGCVFYGVTFIVAMRIQVKLSQIYEASEVPSVAFIVCHPGAFPIAFLFRSCFLQPTKTDERPHFA